MVRVNIAEFKRIKRLKKASRKAHADGNAKLTAIGSGRPVSVRGKAVGRGEPIPVSVKLEVWTRDSGICRRCFSTTCQPVEPHHVKFRSRGGSNEPKNLILLGARCHRAVHDHRPDTDQFRSFRWQEEGQTEADAARQG